MAKGDDLQERMIDFAVAVIGFCSALPKTQTGKHIGGQLLRSGTAAAPNYAEARGAESKKDFVHKLRIALKELNETKVWLEIARRSELVATDAVVPILGECVELSRIVTSSIKTVSRIQ